MLGAGFLDLLKVIISRKNDANDIRPIDESACYNDDGTMDVELYHDYLEREENEYHARRNTILSMLLWDKISSKRRKRARALQRQKPDRPLKRSRIKQQKFFTDPSTGIVRAVTPRVSLWWILYIQDPQPDNSQWSKTFRKRFRLPYESFRQLLSMIDDEKETPDDCFYRWREDGVSNRKVSPMELLVLGSLRYLGRGWTFDDLEESTFIDKEVHRVFFHKFVEFGAKKLYPKFVTMPSTIEELRDCEAEYRSAGFPGCIGSTDATHIPLEKVSFGLRQAHLGYKMSVTTRTYNLTVNHRRKILHSTTGHPGRWNDKTLVRFDGFMQQLRIGEFNSTMSFVLSNEHGRDVTIKGAYVIVDNGYLTWSTTVPPLKDSMNRGEIRFSQWLESLRKDVECTFGILKGRWRVLKTGIRMHNTEVADNIWLTCCALHNMLLDVDGLSTGWNNGVPSDWELDSGDFDESDLPDSIRRLIDPTGGVVGVCSYDATSIGRDYQGSSNRVDIDDDEDNDSQIADDDDDNQIVVDTEQFTATDGIAVNHLSLSMFRSLLINHFNDSFQKNKVVWPTRLTKQPRHVPTTPITNTY